MKNLMIIGFIIAIVLLSIIPVNATELDSFINRNCELIQYNNCKIYIPEDLDTTKQLITIDELKQALDNIPSEYYTGVKIYLLDTEFPESTTVAASYNYQNNAIKFYKNDDNQDVELWIDIYEGFKVSHFDIHRELQSILTHELGHKLDNLTLSKNKIYEIAYKMEYKFNENIAEDFADAFEQYINNVEVFRKYCPVKYYFFNMITK